MNEEEIERILREHIKDLARIYDHRDLLSQEWQWVVHWNGKNLKVFCQLAQQPLNLTQGEWAYRVAVPDEEFTYDDPEACELAALALIDELIDIGDLETPGLGMTGNANQTISQTTLFGTKVEDEKVVANYVTLLAEVYTTPRNTGLEMGEPNSKCVASCLNQRMLRLKECFDQKLSIAEARKQIFKLTDGEKLTILSNITLKGPLDNDYFQEMQRLWFRVMGEESYKAVFGDESLPKEPLYDLWKGK